MARGVNKVIIVGNLGARELEMIDGDVGIGDEDRLAVGRWDGGDHVDHAADALQGDLRLHLGEVVRVGPRLHL